MGDSPRYTPPSPRFPHRDAVMETRRRIFGLFQLADPDMQTALFASHLVVNSTTLLQGTYGVGKTQYARLAARGLFRDADGTEMWASTSCHQDLTAFDVLYHLDLALLQQGREVVHPKAMVGARLKFFNEIQRAGTGLFNALLPLLAERTLEYRDHRFPVPDFICLLDRNPQDAGSSEIPEAFLDRIDFGFEIPAVHTRETLLMDRIRRTPDGYRWGGMDGFLEPVMGIRELQEVWDDVRRVDIPRRSLLMAGMLTDALRLCVVADRSTSRAEFDLECEACEFQGEVCSHLRQVPGQRVTHSVLRLAQALAWLDGAGSVGQGHLRAALPWTLTHRLHLRPEELRTKPNPLAWVRETALQGMLMPKEQHWSWALDALEGLMDMEVREGNSEADRHRSTLDDLGRSDLVVRSLKLMADDLP